jgi:hypothetical protein
MIKDRVGEPFDGLVAPLTCVLVLLPGFTLPIFDAKVAQYVFHFLTDFNLGTITDELGGRTTASDIILKSIDKLTF